MSVRKLFAALLALMLALLAGCAQQPPIWASNGVPDLMEIALIENQYLKSVHETAKSMGFDTWVRNDDLNALELDTPRSIAGLDYTQRLMYSRSSNEFHGVTFSTGALDTLTDEERHDLLNIVTKLEFNLSDAYGPPESEDYSPASGGAGNGSLNDWLLECLTAEPYEGQAGVVTGYAVIHWSVGGMTHLSMRVQVMEGRYYLISMEYRLQIVQNGQMLTGDELREQVRKFQE